MTFTKATQSSDLIKALLNAVRADLVLDGTNYSVIAQWDLPPHRLRTPEDVDNYFSKVVEPLAQLMQFSQQPLIDELHTQIEKLSQDNSRLKVANELLESIVKEKT